MLTALDKKIIAALQKDIDITPRPFATIADQLGISEKKLLASIQDLCDRGIIRRFGATIRHQKSGFEANAMVAWQVAEHRAEEVGGKLAQRSEVTHCYRRNPSDRWPYNLYTMIHAADEAACREIARKMSQAVQVTAYTLLFSRRELKKTSMQYFPTD